MFWRLLVMVFLIWGTGLSYSQSLNYNDLVKIKDKFIPDVIQLHDSSIVYPVTGMISIKIKQEYNPVAAKEYAEIEIWVIDATGKVVYNTIINTLGLPNQPIDKDYVTYMKHQRKNMLNRTYPTSSNN
jgi:hypothetical protein